MLFSLSLSKSFVVDFKLKFLWTPDKLHMDSRYIYGLKSKNAIFGRIHWSSGEILEFI